MALECIFDDSVAQTLRGHLDSAESGDKGAAVALLKEIDEWNRSGDRCSVEALGNALADDGFMLVDDSGDSYDGEVHGETPNLALTPQAEQTVKAVIKGP